MLTNLATQVGRLKHWQVFIPIMAMLVLPWLHDYAVIQEHMANPRGLPLEDIDFVRFGDVILSMSSLAVLFFWVWSIAYCSATRASSVKNAAASRAAIALLFFFACFHAMPWVLQHVSALADPHNALLLFAMLIILAMSSFLYAYGVAAKSLVSAENNSVATLNEYLNTFYLILLFPFGVWSVQSRMNAVVCRIPSELDSEV